MIRKLQDAQQSDHFVLPFKVEEVFYFLRGFISSQTVSSRSTVSVLLLGIVPGEPKMALEVFDHLEPWQRLVEGPISSQYDPHHSDFHMPIPPLQFVLQATG